MTEEEGVCKTCGKRTRNPALRRCDACYILAALMAANPERTKAILKEIQK